MQDNVVKQIKKVFLECKKNNLIREFLYNKQNQFDYIICFYIVS
jgi:hypothetical protein